MRAPFIWEIVNTPLPGKPDDDWNDRKSDYKRRKETKQDSVHKIK